MNSSPSSSNPVELDTTKLPAHVAIIMDGNGRWAKKRLLNRINGHEKGSDTVRAVVRACREIGISYLTLYAFSTENWQRPKTEVEALMSLLKNFLHSEQKELVENNIRLRVIGQVERLPAKVQQALHQTMAATEGNTAMTLILALSYGSRAEIIRMVQDVASQVKREEIDPKALGHFVDLLDLDKEHRDADPGRNAVGIGSESRIITAELTAEGTFLRLGWMRAPRQREC